MTVLLLVLAAGPADTVDQNHLAGVDGIEPRNGDDAGDAQRARDDRGVAGRPAQRGGQCDNKIGIQAGGVGRREVFGAQDRRNGRQRDSGRPCARSMVDVG